MFIEHSLKPVPWADRTMTVLRRNRLQACEKDLAGLSAHALFDSGTTDKDAEDIYASSWYAFDEKPESLHTVTGLRARVLEELPAALALLTPEENELMLRAVVLGGTVPLIRPDNLFPALSLARRLWGRIENGPFCRVFRLSGQVFMASVLILFTDAHRQLHDRFLEVFNTVDNTLYLAGLLNAETVLQDMVAVFRDTPAADCIPLYRASLRAGFDTFIDRTGALFLIHPGLADPQQLLKSRHPGSGMTFVGRDAVELTAAYESLTELEDPMYDHLLSLINDLTRQEVQPEDIIEDLIILIKQGAGYSELKEVLSSQLVCIPTPEMKAVLQEMADRIPRWSSLNMGRIQ